MSDGRIYSEESPAVQSHLNIAQSVIQRMALNCASCKAWSITLVAAILVVIADKNKPNYALIAVIPAVLFLVLDTYYLALERCFRASYNDFIDKVHSGRVAATDLYAVTPTGSLPKVFIKSICSFSVWPFYVTLGGMIWLLSRLVLV
jgi:hypothetical protein